jgi:hypothetical protein
MDTLAQRPAFGKATGPAKLKVVTVLLDKLTADLEHPSMTPKGG